MAGYNIVLNLGGNAVSRSEKLAANLGLAATNATTLAAALRSVGTAAAAVPARTIRVGAASAGSGIRGASYATYNGRFREYIQGMTRQSDAMRSMSKYYKELERTSKALEDTRWVNSRPRRTRHRSTNILSYGAGFNIGGFSGRFSTILQPDADGKLLGMNAESLMSGLNTAAIGAHVAKSVGKFLFKNIARATIGRMAVGGVGTMMLSNVLMSEGMGEGVRIVQRRNQARLGLGMEGYVAANDKADELAREYGLERSVALSSLNVLTGMGTSGGSRLSMDNAAALTRVGGLISQQAGVSFERVMTNFQQIISQDKPNTRDIRELLNQAPILKRYAIDEIAKSGENIDANTWLKDPKNFMNVLARYDLENSSSMIMQARGLVNVSKQDMWATLSQNDSWMTVAMNASSLITTFGEALSSVITSLNNDTGFRNSINALISFVEILGNNSESITNLVSDLTRKYASFFGIDPYEAARGGRIRTQKQQVIENAFDQNRETLWERFKNSPKALGTDEKLLRRQFNTYFVSQRAAAASNPELLEKVNLGAPLYNTANFPIASNDWLRLYANAGTYGYKNAHSTWQESTMAGMRGEQNILLAKNVRTVSPASEFGYGSVATGYITDFFAEGLFKAVSKIPTDLRSKFDDPAGSDLSSFNKDRRNLEIHFHDAIVKWTSNISTDDPQEVVAEVKQNIDQIASEAIQKAMLAATGKMGTRWI